MFVYEAHTSVLYSLLCLQIMLVHTDIHNRFANPDSNPLP